VDLTPTRKSSTSGTPTQPASAQPTRGTITDQQLSDLKACREELQIPLEAWRNQILGKRGVKSGVELSAEKAAELISALRTKINARQMQEALTATRNGDLTLDVNAVGGKEVSATGPIIKSDN